MKPPRIVSIAFLAFTFASCGHRTLQEGDLVFLVSPSPHTDPILLATKSQYGHVGMVLKHKGELMFFEAVSPVKYTPLTAWMKSQENKHFVVKRLENADVTLTGGNLSRMDSLAATFEGKPYDSKYNWSDDKLYCSELVWKIFNRILGIELCQLRKLKDYDLTPPEVQKKLKERYPDGVPLEETVVSPQDLFDGRSLTTVYQQ